MVQKFIIIIIAYFSTTLAIHYESPYKEVLDCDWDKACWSFVDEYMLKLINRFNNSDTSPCNDFYEYSLDYYYSPGKDENLFDFVEMLFDDKMEEFIKKPIQNDPKKSDLRILLSKMKFYYDQCEQHTQDIITPPILDNLPSMTTLTWPDWSKSFSESEWQTNFSSVNYIAELRRLGLNRLFFDEHIAIAYNDSTRYVVELTIPDEIQEDMLPPDFLLSLENFNITKYIQYRQMPFKNRIDELEELAKNVRTMHRARIGLNKNKKLLTLGDLKVKVPNIDWQNFFNALLRHAHITDELLIQIDSLDYYKDIGTLIDQTDDKTLAFYILLRFLYYTLNVMPTENFGSCKEQMSLQFSLGANYIYDRFIYESRDRDETELEGIFTALKDQFSKSISKNKLNLSPEEQDSLQQKLNEMTLKIGNLPSKKSAAYYNRYYDEVGNFELNFWRSQWKMLRFNFDRQHVKLLKNNGQVESETDFVSDNVYKQRSMPYYEKAQNRIIVPFEFVRPPFFTHGQNPVFRQSITAFSIARELMAAILNEMDGSSLQNQAFRDVWKCLEGNEELFVEERFADIAGLQLVVDTYFNELNNEMRKLFFLYLAQYFAGHAKDSYKFGSDSKKQEFDDRFNLIVSNVPEFSHVFNCTEGTPINLEKKCQVW